MQQEARSWGFGTDTLKRQLRLRIFLKGPLGAMRPCSFFAFSQERFALPRNLAATIALGAIVTIWLSSFGKLASGAAF
jgi:hypothetical protein